MATIEEINRVMKNIEQALSAKFDENDKRHTALIIDLQSQFHNHERRFSTLEQVVQQSITPAESSAPAPPQRSLTPNESLDRRSRGFQLSLEKYDGKPRTDLGSWIAQVEEKCSLQHIPGDEVGRWAKVHLEGNALAFISRLGITDWNEIKLHLQRQFVPRHNNQLLRMQMLKLRQHGDIQMYIHEFQAVLNKVDDDMAMGDQLFYFINGLSTECRRYVELHQPDTLQSALELCLNFEHVHSNGVSNTPMELNFFQPRRFRNQGRKFGPRSFSNSSRINFIRSGRNQFNNGGNSRFGSPNGNFHSDRSYSSNRGNRWTPRRFQSNQNPRSNFAGNPQPNYGQPLNSTPTNYRRGRGRGRGRFNSGNRGRAQFHLLGSSNLPSPTQFTEAEQSTSTQFCDDVIPTSQQGPMIPTSGNYTGSRAVWPHP